MKIILKGIIKSNNPMIRAGITKEGDIFFKNNGKIHLTIDTGFDGGIALPEKILSKLNLIPSGKEKYLLANGQSIELRIYLGKIIIGKHILFTFFVNGDYLMGMRLMSSIAKVLKVNFDYKKVELLR